MTLPSVPTAPAAVRLTQLSHGGGRGCKIAPGVRVRDGGSGKAAVVGEVGAASTVVAVH